jgi:two-component system, LytTR family, sensor kinase
MQSTAPTLNTRRVWLYSLIGWTAIAISATFLDYLTALFMSHYGEAPRIPLVRVAKICFIEFGFWAVSTPIITVFTQGYELRREKLIGSLAKLGGWLVLFWVMHACYRALTNRFLYPAAEVNGFVAVLNYYLLAKVGNDMWVFGSIVGFNHIRSHYRHATERDQELARAQLLLLKRQIQPHFFFNALNSISSLMHRDVNAADDMMSELAGLLRMTLQTNMALKADLAQEIELIESYLGIEAIRFGKKLQYEIDVPPDLYGCAVPSLILQPIVENAVLHGIFPMQRPGAIRISAREKSGSLVLSVSDNGEGFQFGRFVEGVGIGNTRARLEQLYGNLQRLVLSQSESGGAEVTITIPLEYTSREEKDTYGSTSSYRG